MNILKKAACVTILEKVNLNNMLKVPLPIFANTKRLSDLTCTVDEQRFFTTVPMKLIKLSIYLAIYHSFIISSDTMISY